MNPRPISLSGSLEFNVDKFIASMVNRLATDKRLIDSIVTGVLVGMNGHPEPQPMPDRGTVQFEDVA
jgi:hypothetical protein